MPRANKFTRVKDAVDDYQRAKKAPTLHGGDATASEIKRISGAETKLIKAVGALIEKDVHAAGRGN